MDEQASQTFAANPECKILIIDDDEDDFLIARSMLKEAKRQRYSIDWASTYEKGQAKLHADDYDAVLVDYDLGMHSGIELIRTATERGYPTPLILYTGRGNYEVDVEAMQAGATLYLTKSEANPLLLERIIRYAIELKQKEHALLAREANLRESEAALRLSEERFNQAFNANPTPQVISRIENGEILDINRSFERLLGYRRSELIGKTSLELNLYANPADRAEAVRQLRAQNSLHHFELDIQTKSGAIRRASLATEMITIGSEPFLLTVLQDITERSQAEEAIRQSEHQYRGLAEALRNSEARLKVHARELTAILDAVPAYVWITHDPLAREVTGNQLVCDLMRVEPGENVSKTGSKPGVLPAYTAMHAGREVDNEELPVQRVAASGMPLRNYDYELIFEDGRRIQFLGNVSPLLDENGKPAGAVSAFIDITSQIQSQEKLTESERVLRQANDRFRVALASAPITVFTTDRDLAITWMYDPQPAFQLEQVLGLRLEQVTPGPYGKAIMEILQSVLDTGQPRQGEIETLSYGKPTYFAYSIDPIRDESGALVGLACAGYDITDHKRIELNLQLYAAELERSNQALVNFAFLASHDLQEPLRKIIMFTKNVRKNAVATLDAESEDYLDRMQNAAERMQTMIDGLLELSQVNRNGAAFAPVNLTSVVEEVVADLKQRIQALEGRVIIEALPTIDADELQMQHVFQNLVENALKFHKVGVAPVVRVSGQVLPAGDQPAMAIIRVEDNGIGLEQQDAKRIFEPFTRLHGRNEYEGTGLGLAICQKIIERHRGTIEVQSSPGQGTRFILRLPVHSSLMPVTKK